MEVVVGCYEQMLLGFRLVEGGEECKLKPTFTDNSHTGCVKAVASGGHVLASGSTDETIHLYNMETRTELGTLLQHDVADLIHWSPKGDMYAVVTGNKINVYRLETAGLKCSLDAGRRVLTMAYITNTALAVAGEDKNIQILNVETGTCTCDFSAHENRIKSLVCVRDHRSDAGETDLLMVSISSDGFIKVWALKTDQACG
uniref:Anaphase-promoting complex subunit 4-like WD40 domain-containing protein n=1 Tax=Branchiostoma floridae TaxID=7739 RepID=C3Y1C2_BRAFL|eukprot:XP_002609652.1 hypothetical protein BRAFLDRAFT_83650 [Branchiostoma floridae]